MLIPNLKGSVELQISSATNVKHHQFVLKPAAELAGLAVQSVHVLINSCDSCTSNRMVLHNLFKLI